MTQYTTGETSKSRLESLANGGVTLSVEGLCESHVLTQPSVFVSWCISAEVAAKIRDARLQGADTPKLLIVDRVIGNSYSERRYLVNLDAPIKMTTLEFTSSGKHRILAVVTTWKELLTRRYGRYETDVFNYDETGITVSVPSLGTTCVDVEIPKEIFAEKPRDWAWVNRWFDEQPFDQCAFRRRRVFAYTLQPPLLAIGYLLLTLKIIAGWFAAAVMVIMQVILGMRGIDTRPLLHPWTNGPGSMLNPTGGSIFWPLVKGQRIPFAILLHPASLVALWFLAKWMWPENAVSDVRNVEWNTFGVFVVWIGVFVFVLGTLIRWASTLSESLEAGREADEAQRTKIAKVAREKREAIELQARRARVEAEVTALICNATGPQEPGVEDLALSFKTIRFHAEAFKRKVCRPFGA